MLSWNWKCLYRALPLIALILKESVTLNSLIFYFLTFCLLLPIAGSPWFLSGDFLRPSDTAFLFSPRKEKEDFQHSNTGSVLHKFMLGLPFQVSCFLGMQRKKLQSPGTEVYTTNPKPWRATGIISFYFLNWFWFCSLFLTLEISL